MQEVLVGDEAQKTNAIRDPGRLARLPHFGSKPGFFAGQNQPMAKLWKTIHELGERFDQPDLVLPRLQVAHRQNERGRELESGSDSVKRVIYMQSTEFR